MRTKENFLELLSKQKILPPNVRFTPTKSDHVAAAIMFILSNEEIFKPYLLELNQKISQKVPTEMHYPVPAEYDTFHSCYQFPAPPSALLSDGQQLITALETVLLAQEQKRGINAGRSINNIPLFIDFIPPDKADELIRKNTLWNEDNYWGWVLVAWKVLAPHAILYCFSIFGGSS